MWDDDPTNPQNKRPDVRPLRALSSENPFAGKSLTAQETDKLLGMIRRRKRLDLAVKVTWYLAVFLLGASAGIGLMVSL